MSPRDLFEQTKTQRIYWDSDHEIVFAEMLPVAHDADDARACNMLPYVALELDPPLNANARRELDARCNEADPKACLRLADVYKWGVGGVIRNAAKSADYAKRVCDAPGDPDAPWKKVACAWNPKPPTPDVGTFAGSGSASGNSALRGIGTVLTLPFSIFF